MVPTILEAAGIQQPEVVNGVQQVPLDGISFAYTFENSKAMGRRHTQTFEVAQNAGIYHDGWWAATKPIGPVWDIYAPTKAFKDRQWELYNLSKDFSQAKDLAKLEPGKLAEMQRLFMKDALHSKVLPIHGITDGTAGKPLLNAGRSHFVLHSGMTRVHESAAPRLIGRSWRISADIVVPSDSGNGVILTHGGLTGGYSLYLKNGIPIFHYNAMLDRQYSISGAQALAPGENQISANFVRDSDTPGAGGMLTITVNGKIVGAGRIDHTLAHWVSVVEGLDVGEDTLTPINEDYSISQSKFQGVIKAVSVDVE